MEKSENGGRVVTVYGGQGTTVYEFLIPKPQIIVPRPKVPPIETKRGPITDVAQPTIPGIQPIQSVPIQNLIEVDPIAAVTALVNQMQSEFTKKFEELSKQMSKIEKQLNLKTTTPTKTSTRPDKRSRRR